MAKLSATCRADGGFSLPEAKSWLAWIDKDTLLVASDWGEGSLTTSGYPRELRRWRRGQSANEAETVAQVSVDDVWVLQPQQHVDLAEGCDREALFLVEQLHLRERRRPI